MPTAAEILFLGSADIQANHLRQPVRSLLNTFEANPDKIDWRNNSVSPAYKLARISYLLHHPPTIPNRPARFETFDVLHTHHLSPLTAITTLAHTLSHGTKISHLHDWYKSHLPHLKSKEVTLPLSPHLLVHVTPGVSPVPHWLYGREYTLGFTHDSVQTLKITNQLLTQELMPTSTSSPPLGVHFVGLGQNREGGVAIHVGVTDQGTAYTQLQNHPSIRTLQSLGLPILIKPSAPPAILHS